MSIKSRPAQQSDYTPRGSIMVGDRVHYGPMTARRIATVIDIQYGDSEGSGGRQDVIRSVTLDNGRSYVPAALSRAI